MYTVFVHNLTTGDLVELPYNSISFVEELNNGKNANFNVDYEGINELAQTYGSDLLTLISSGFREIWVKKDSTKVYIGVITDLSINQDNLGTLSVQIASVGYFNILSKRRTDSLRTFSNTDAGEIAWTLIDESQLSDPPYSDFGIVEGAIAESKDRDRTFRFANIKEEIWQMSNNNLKNGYDVEIDNNKAFNIYYPQKGSNRAEIILDDRNILSWGYRKPLVQSLTNRVYVTGEGINDDKVYVVRESDDAYKTAYKLLEDVLSEPDVKETDTLNDKGDRFLLDNQSPRIALSIAHADDEPDILDYEVGDSIRVRIDELAINMVYFRVLKRSVSIDKQGAAKVQLDLI